MNVFTDNEGQTVFNALSIKVKGSELEITRKIKDKTSVGQLNEGLSAKIPVALNISGKGVLTKILYGTEEITTSSFSKVIPNANWEEFYVQQVTEGEQNFVSIIRKSDAERWLKEFDAAGLEILSLSLGPFVVKHTFSQLNVYESALQFDGHRVERDAQGNLLNYKYDKAYTADFPIKIENEKLDEQLLLPYAAAFQLMLAGNLDMIEADIPSVSLRLKAALNDRKIIVFSVLTLGVLFVLLLINSFLFTNYTTQNEELALKNMQTEHSSKDLDSLSRQIKKSEALLDSLGWEDNINQSVLVDRIAQLLPPDIQWTDLAVSPVDRSREGHEQKIRFLQRKISVTGTTQKIVLVNEWLERIKSQSWVKDAQLKHYTYNNQENTGVFHILIAY